MLERIEGIVLDVIRHNDSNNVVTLYTRQHGRMAFLVPVGKTGAGRLRNTTLSLMAVVSAEVTIRPGKELYRLRQPQPMRLWHDIYSNPVKTSLIFFLAEFCHRLVRQYPADPRLWEYIKGSLELLESLPADRVASFHIAFLVRLLPLAGIEPQARSWQRGELFDMLSGEMISPEDALIPGIRAASMGSANALRNALDEEESRFVPLLLRISFANMHRFRLSRLDKQRILSRLLSYYSLHLPIGTDMKSLTVLRELFE